MSLLYLFIYLYLTCIESDTQDNRRHPVDRDKRNSDTHIYMQLYAIYPSVCLSGYDVDCSSLSRYHIFCYPAHVSLTDHRRIIKRFASAPAHVGCYCVVENICHCSITHGEITAVMILCCSRASRQDLR